MVKIFPLRVERKSAVRNVSEGAVSDLKSATAGGGPAPPRAPGTAAPEGQRDEGPTEWVLSRLAACAR